MCLLSFLPGFKSRQGRALQLSNTSFKTELGKEILILKRMKTSSSQEKKMAGERKQKVLSKTAAMATITNMEKKDILSSLFLQRQELILLLLQTGSLKAQVFLLQLFQEIFM